MGPALASMPAGCLPRRLLVMTVPLTRPRRRPVRFGPLLASRLRRSTSRWTMVQLAIGSLLIGVLLGLLLTWRDSSPLTALILGGLVLTWSLSSFGSERPD